jgi:hypothetical protein
MATLEELKTEATAEVEAAKPLNISISGAVREMNEAEYAQRIIDITNFKWQDQQFGYIQARQEAYGSIGDQLDMQYKDILNDTTTWKDHIAKVKSDYPKPE